MQETVDRQEQLRRMEIGALQEQINPHFSTTRSDSIVRVMETGRTPEAIEMVQALAAVLGLSINNGDYFLTVEQEMDYAATISPFNRCGIEKIQIRALYGRASRTCPAQDHLAAADRKFP